MQSNKWLSRKFIVSATTQLAGIAILIWPGQEEAIAGAAQSIAALIVLGLAALGYVKTEGELDRQSLQRPASEGSDSEGSTASPAPAS